MLDGILTVGKKEEEEEETQENKQTETTIGLCASFTDAFIVRRMLRMHHMDDTRYGTT